MDSSAPRRPSSSSPAPQPASMPEIQPPGTPPKKFPEKQPLSDDGLEAAKKESASTIESSSRSGSGEDPSVESGISENDPEQPREPEAE